jgi:hypothetical protein
MISPTTTFGTHELTQMTTKPARQINSTQNHPRCQPVPWEWGQGEIAMLKNWEEMTANEKLSVLRSEVDSLSRVTNGVVRRIEEIRSELKTIESMLEQKDGGA